MVRFGPGRSRKLDPVTIIEQRPRLQVPRWAERVAHTIPLLALPSGLWRVGIDSWEAVYVFGLSIVAELVALTAFGLVRSWGEVFPRWIPVLRGRRVPPLAAVIPAVLGSLALIVIWAYGFRDLFFGFDDVQLRFANDAWAALMIACYAPLNLWGPLLLVLTWHYYRRRAR